MPLPYAVLAVKQATVVELQGVAAVKQAALYAIDDEGDVVGAYANWLAAVTDWQEDGAPLEGATRTAVIAAGTALDVARQEYDAARRAVANGVADIVVSLLEGPTYAPPSPAAQARDITYETVRATLPNVPVVAWNVPSTVVSMEMTSPLPDADDVAVDAEFVFEFDAPINTTLTTLGSFTLVAAETTNCAALTLVWSEGDTVATVTFEAMNNDEIYTVSVDAVAADGADTYWVDSEPEIRAVDITAPAVASTSPANAATAVAVDAVLTVTFNDAMDPATVTAATCHLVAAGGGAADVATSSVAMSVGNTVATLTMADDLTPETVYKFKVTAVAEDSSGNACTAFQSAAGFTTAAA